MTDGQTVWLAVIALSVAVMAIVQVATILVAVKYGRELARSLEEFRRDVRPVLDKAHKISEDAARVAALAATQIERLDKIMSTTAARIDETMGIVQGAIIEPVRHGAAMMAAVRAAFAVIRGFRDRDRATRDDEEALFVG